ncbi:hypothetical protein [Candidatus Amarolinea dominans]|uniref:hypothetical protein n=1 Tax=Candidatus Amarolinea dominans TaxID=3140696 RepID=UPI001D34E26B|nr:hypothetical protein [Anaerolineae bacterium]MBK9095536.1 hypothetical protein [Anaerolineae bacterium]
MPSNEVMEWVKTIGSLLCSLPVMILLALVIFRKPLRKLIDQFAGTDVKRAKIGPVEIERELGNLAKEGKQAVETMNRLNVLMAESRLLELEITEGMFGSVFSPSQRQQMKEQINELRKLTYKATEGESGEGKNPK